MAVIDIGSAAIDRPGSYTGNVTYIDLTNPADGTGEITTVAIWARVGYELASAYAAIFYRPDPDGFPANFTARSVSANLGEVSTYEEFAVNLNVVEGDFIGIYFTDASDYLERTSSGGSGVYYLAGDQTACSNTTFTLNALHAMSVYGTGTSVSDNYFGYNSS